jgi:hypothetical protein
MPSYILGRDQATTAPGVVNDDIQNVELKLSGSEQDVTVFKDSALTQVQTMVGLIDVSFEITCTHATATVGQFGTFTVGNLDGGSLQLDAVVTDVKRTVTPKGIEQYVVSYGVKPAAD